MSSFTAIRQESLVKHLRREVAGEVRFDDTSRRLYATDASHYQIVPLGVVLPKSIDDLVATVQIAGELDIPITARGGGTSLSGQAIGPGIVIDCSKYLNRISDIDNDTVTVQAGVVLDQLNRAVASRGLQFGPDVAPSSRATIGGMIGNNSAGARSVIYGQTLDHVQSLSLILADGTRTTVASFDALTFQRKLELRSLEGEIYRRVTTECHSHAEEIRTRTPSILRKVSGYNLLGCLNAERSLLPLFVGSEGTLAVVAEATLKLVAKPSCRGLVVPHFTTLKAALEAVAVCLQAKPSAVELIDEHFITLARHQLALRHTTSLIEGEPAAMLFVEISGDSELEVRDRIAKLQQQLGTVNGLSAVVSATDPAKRDALWSLRTAGMPLLMGMPGKRKPVTFVEDCAVSPERMPEFAMRFRDILQTHGTVGAYYGHAGVGCLHIRPLLDLHDDGDVAKLRPIMRDVTALVREFAGSLSGEHGDGIVRSEWNRTMFGETLYESFRRIKQTCDPRNILNPGRIVDGPPMEQNLRPGPPTDMPLTLFDYTKQGGFFRSIELCNGNGACRKTQGGTMCPSFRATRDEKESTRGRANALRLAMTSDNALSVTGQPLEQRWLKDVMDLCLSCKACKAECPSNVDMAKLKAEFQHAYYRRRPRPILHRMVRRVDTLSPIAARFGGLGNWFSRRGIVRRLLQAATGIDRRRNLPSLHRNHFRKWFLQRQSSVTEPMRKVILLDDCFTTFQEPTIGQAAVELLEHAGCEVELANICCGRTAISKGYLREAQERAKLGIARLAAAAKAGTPILGLEPSCILTLCDEWPELVPGSDADAIAKSVHFAETWLSDNALSLDFKPYTGPIVYHGHCQQKALIGTQGSVDALKCDVKVLDAGCCGMAGAFGYETEHYDISVAIANLSLIPSLNANPNATIIATGTSCRHQIRDLTGRQALHPLELMRASLIRGDFLGE